jgi:hypothetical protein
MRGRTCASRFLTLDAQGRHEPPAVAFGVAGGVFALAVGLVNGVAVDAGAGGAGVVVVGVHVIDLEDEAGVGDVGGAGGVEVVVGGGAVEPDRGVAGADFAVDGEAVGGAVDAPGS